MDGVYARELATGSVTTLRNGTGNYRGLTLDEEATPVAELDALARRKTFGDPAIFDRAENARHFGPGGHAPADDLPALERENGHLPVDQRRRIGARQQ